MIMSNKKLLLTACLCAASLTMMAQSKRISGTVSDAMGPVMMANITEIDANNRIVSAAQTDFNGNFSMEVKSPKNKLRISFVGDKTKTITVGDKEVFDIVLESDSHTIQEVVVKGTRMGSGGLFIPKREVSVAQQTFDMSSVEGMAFTSADEALQGEIAGLDIVSNSGNLGSGTTMRLRGVTTINGDAQPLIVVDDRIFDNPDETFDFSNANEEQYASLLSVNVEDIASIQVLKDAAATAVWGSKGSNGVIQITTKRGARGKTRVNFSYKFTGTWQPDGYKLLNGDDYTMLMKEEFYNPKQASNATTNIAELNYDQSWSEYENWNNNTDWVKAVKQFGQMHSYNVNLTGGGQKAQFRISAGYDHQTGSIIKQTLDRFSTRLVLDYNVSDRIKFSTNFALTYTNNNQNYSGLLGIAQKLAPNMSIYRQNADGTDTNEYYVMLPTGKDYVGSTVPNTSSKELEDIRNQGNPVAIANLAWRKEKTYRISPEFKLDYKLLGTDDTKTMLNYTGLVYMDIYASSTPKYWPAALSTKSWDDANYNRNESNESNSLGFTTRHTLTFTPAFHNKDLYATMFGRWEMTVGNNNRQNKVLLNVPNGVESSDVQGGKIDGMSSGNGQWRSMSALLNSHFSYKGRYSLGFSLRADGTTKFGDSKKWGYFPGVSARWNISDEGFMKWSKKWLSMLSFRPSWGIVGHQPGSEYLQYAKYASYGVYGQTGSTDGVTYLEALQLNKLRWEKTTQINLGGDFSFFNDLIRGDFNYYYKKTKDLLMSNVRIPSTNGFGTLAWSNVGDMENKGWELNVEANKFIRVGKFSMSANFNISQNFNKITAMDESVLESINSEWKAGERGSYLNRIQIGNPLGSIFGLKYKGVYQYTYEYLINMKERNKWTGEQLRDYINKEFLPSGKTAPIAIDKDGKVLMGSTGEPIRQVYNFKDGSSTYKFQGGDAIYEDINHDGQINSLDIVYLGNSNPKVNGGFGFNFFWGSSWSLRTSFSYRSGIKVINKAKMGLEQMFNAYNQSSAVNWRWRKNGDVTMIPRAMFNSAYNFLGSDRYVEDASFVRMSYVQLSYNFDKKFLKSIGLRRLQLSLSGQNLLCFSKYSGSDPEHSAGGWGIATDNSQTPRSKSVTMNINVGF